MENDFLILERDNDGNLRSISGFLDNEELAFKNDGFYLDGVFLVERRKALWFLVDYGWYLLRPSDIIIFIVNFIISFMY